MTLPIVLRTTFESSTMSIRGRLSVPISRLLFPLIIRKMPHIGGAVPTEAPSGWVLRWAPLVERGPLLDLACGGGRHARLFAARGLEVVAVDRESQVFRGKESSS